MNNIGFVAETGIPTIAHHHDFSWERKRYKMHSVPKPSIRNPPFRVITVRHRRKYHESIL